MEITAMKYDDVAWERSDELFKIFKDKLWAEGVAHKVAMLIKKYRMGSPTELMPPFAGSWNVCLRLKFLDGGSGVIRFPVSGRIMFPEEKIHAEVAAMRFIAAHTTIPLPLVHHVGATAEGPGGLGPFIVMEYAEHATNLGKALSDPSLTKDERPRLDLNIGEMRLKFLYGKAAQVMLRLSMPSLPRIGSFSQIDEFEWSITERPLTYNMNQLVQIGDVDFDRLPTATFSTSSSYYCALADMNLEHLSAQHNDAIVSEDDCRCKYVARHLFRRLAEQGQLDTFPAFENGPFKLFCEDLRPTNFLTTEGSTVTAVVDWEFTFAAPASFAFSPPWWLLLERPEDWRLGLDDWEYEYTSRLHIWLSALEAEEEAAISRGSLEKHQTLSNRMRHNWESGAFWINYAAHNSWAFDVVYFSRLDKKFFGEIKGDWLTQRLPLLTEVQKSDMEAFVQRKMAQKADRRLVDSRFDAFV